MPSFVKSHGKEIFQFILREGLGSCSRKGKRFFSLFYVKALVRVVVR